MGYLQASEMAARLPLRDALRWHLQHNHVPPVPELLVEVAFRAVDDAREGHWETQIALPEGVTFRGRPYIMVEKAIQSLHLEAFINGHRPGRSPDAGVEEEG